MASIIDNRNKTMLESLKNSLKQAESVDILTAFFYFSGFNALAEDLKDKKTRILVGNTIDPESIGGVCHAVKDGLDDFLETYAIRGYSRLNNSQKKNCYINVDEISDISTKIEDPILNKIRKYCKNTVDSYFAVKDVGFNYWSEEKGKSRYGNSIGNRILYSNTKENSTDIGYIKGQDFYRYSLPKVNNFLRYNYQTFLNPNDTFRFSPDILVTSPKIIYRQMANSIIATMDTQGLLVDKTVHIIVSKRYDYDIYLLLGLFDSKLFQYLYLNLFQDTKGRVFSQVKTVYIKQLPLKTISQVDAENIIKLVKKALLSVFFQFGFHMQTNYGEV